ncbi:MAG: hypothetical protein PHX27_04020 [Candidatus ainarchaeum sp.]|nr:hypothetical protein [Candidatus ainarchaeum sp.]
MDSKNKYTIFLLIVVTILFFYTSMEALALTCVLITLILIVYNPVKKNSKKIWSEVDKAKPKDITPIIKSHYDTTTKLAADLITGPPKTQHQLTSIHQFQKGTKNFFSELKKIFK